MKRCIVIFALCLISFGLAAMDDTTSDYTFQVGSEFQPLVLIPQFEVESRSFMYMRPAYDHLSMREQAWWRFDYPRDRCINGTIQAIGFFQDSLHKTPCHGHNRFARYFLPYGKDEPLMAGDNTPYACIRDLRAEWFNLPSTFSGSLTLNPSQFQAGFLLQYNQDLNTLFNSSFFDQSYLSITVPFIHVKNNLHLEQHHVQNPGPDRGGLPQDILQAFNQPAWHFDKIDGPQTKNHFSYLKLTMNRIFMNMDNYQFAYYSGVVIPTAPKPNPEFLFNAYVGNGQHFGLNAGVALNINLSNLQDCGLWSFFLDLDGTFLVKNKQHRTVDLRNKPWSRFLLFNRECDPLGTNIPGVNVLTIRTLVHSFGIFDFATGFRYSTDWYELEAGYNVWGHDHERLNFVDPFPAHIGIASPIPDASGNPQTASTSTIAQLGAPDPVFVPIKQTDLNLHSASAGSSLNQKFHAALSIYKDNDIAPFAGIGMFVDWAHKNSPLPAWGAWAKLGCSF